MCCDNWVIFFHQQTKNPETAQTKHFAQQRAGSPAVPGTAAAQSEDAIAAQLWNTSAAVKLVKEIPEKWSNTKGKIKQEVAQWSCW